MSNPCPLEALPAAKPIPGRKLLHGKEAQTAVMDAVD
jgi:hypothetical protein